MAKLAGWMKLSAALLLMGALGAAAVLVALKTFFPEPKLRAMVVDGARKQLGRDVKLERIAVGLRGLHLEGLQVSESPDFTAGTFVSVESFRARPSWRALLRRRLVVASVEASGLNVRVVKRADGSFNFSNLASTPSATPAPSSPTGTERPELSIRHVRVSRGAVVYKDAPAKEEWELSDVSLSGDDLGLAAPFDVDASLRARGERAGRPVDVKLAFSGVVDPARGDLAKLKVKARKLSVETEGLVLRASGQVDGLVPPRADFDASLSASGKTVLEAEGEVRLSSAAGGDFLAEVRAETPGLDTTWLAKLLPSAGVPALVVPAAKLTLKAERRGTEAHLRDFALTWKDGKANGHVRAKGLGTAAPAYDGRIEASVSLPAVAPGQYAFLKLPPKLSVPASKIEAALSFSGDSAKVESLRVVVPQGSLSASGAVSKLGSAKPVPDLTAVLALALPSVKVSELPIAVAALPAGYALPAARVDGTIKVKGDDVRFEGLALSFKGGKVVLDGVVLKALSGASPRPELEARGELALPALTDEDLPFAGVPAGLQLPASSWEGDLDYTSERLRVRKLRVRIGGNDVAVEGTIGDPAGRMAYDLLVKCKSFVLEELTRLTPATRGMELKGSGFVALSVTGAGAKPVFAGKAQFRGAGATVAGLPLSEFNGTASFDERRLDVPNLKGKVADGSLEMDLTVKDFAKAPEITLDASLDRFDLGRFLDAKKRWQSERAAAKPSQAAKAGEPAAVAPPMRSRGTFSVGSLVHPSATVASVKASWDLSGIASDLRPLNGNARLSVAGGRLRSAKDMGAQNPALKVLTIPLTVIQGLGRAVTGFPDLSDIEVRSITGDYLIQNGVMHVRESRLDSEKAVVSATGSVDLPKEALDLVVTAQVGRVAPMDVEVKGTISAPKTNLKVGKFIGDALQSGLEGLLQKAVKPTQ